ncbi:hypothetical protein FQA39_LY14470 [Lamprigera yunnana]|nr:hypothetical protein FQA39_LY14470 [Lamprigera yunnana]
MRCSNKNRKCEKPPLLTLICVHLGFYILFFVYLFSRILRPQGLRKEKNRDGYPPLFRTSHFFLFFHFLYERVRDAWNHTVCSVPGVEIVVKHREFNPGTGILNFRFTGERTKCLNVASYNYLGFAENTGMCTEFAIETIYKFGVSNGASTLYYGYGKLHQELDGLLAEFLGVEDVISYSMGFATNSVNLPALLSSHCLVLSDEKNHVSIIVGLQVSGASVKVFRHNDVDHLEELLQQGILNGQPNHNIFKPWKKIVIIVEGIYSMEGSIVRLPEIIELKKKYKAYLYLDEAHSLGAIGKSGKGVVEYFNCDPKEVDVLMGTYTKSFSSVGGFIGGSKDLISFLRQESYACKYGRVMSPIVVAQIIGVLRILMERNEASIGKKRIETLARNTKYFRRKLNEMGFITYGNPDSPVVPVLCYYYSKIAIIIKTLLEHNIAAIGVGFPATSLFEGRMRFCLSGGHTKEELDYVLDVFSKIGDQVGLKYSSSPRNFDVVDDVLT